MSKYIQTTLADENYKKLRIIAIKRDIPMLDLIREILVEWLNNQQEENHHGTEETQQEN